VASPVVSTPGNVRSRKQVSYAWELHPQKHNKSESREFFLENQNYENLGAWGEDTQAVWINRNYFLRKFIDSSQTMRRLCLSSPGRGGRAAVLMEPEGREGNALKPVLKSLVLHTMFSSFES